MDISLNMSINLQIIDTLLEYVAVIDTLLCEQLIELRIQIFACFCRI